MRKPVFWQMLSLVTTPATRPSSLLIEPECCSVSSKQPRLPGKAQSFSSPVKRMSLAKWFVLGNRHMQQSWPMRQEGNVPEGLWKEFSHSWKGTHHRVISCFCLWKNAKIYLFLYPFNEYLLPSLCPEIPSLPVLELERGGFKIIGEFQKNKLIKSNKIIGKFRRHIPIKSCTLKIERKCKGISSPEALRTGFPAKQFRRPSLERLGRRKCMLWTKAEGKEIGRRRTAPGFQENQQTPKPRRPTRSHKRIQCRSPGLKSRTHSPRIWKPNTRWNGMKLLMSYQGCLLSAVILIPPLHRHVCARLSACGQGRTESSPAGWALITVQTPVLLPLLSLSRISSYFSGLSFGALFFCPPHKSSVLKVGSRDPWGCLRHFRGKCDIKTIFITIRRYLSFPFSFCHVCTVELSRDHMMCDRATDWRQK